MIVTKPAKEKKTENRKEAGKSQPLGRSLINDANPNERSKHGNVPSHFLASSGASYDGDRSSSTDQRMSGGRVSVHACVESSC